MRGEQFTVADGGRRWALKYGQQKINLHQHKREFDPKGINTMLMGSGFKKLFSDKSILYESDKATHTPAGAAKAVTGNCPVKRAAGIAPKPNHASAT